MYIAGANYHKIPYEIVDFGMSKLPNDMKDMILRRIQPKSVIQLA